MAITNRAGVISGLQWSRHFIKNSAGTSVAGRFQSTWAGAGSPGAGSYDATLNGVTLTAPVTGQLPWVDPAVGVGYLAQLRAATTTTNFSIMLADRLWHNGGFDVTSTSAQSITSPTWPARDINGATSGDGVFLAVEVSAAVGAGTPTITVSYTNEAGTSGRTGTNLEATAASASTGAFYRIGLDTGDKGVRSVQSLTLSATWTSGTINLVAYRPIAILDGSVVTGRSVIDDIVSGLPRMYNGTVPFLLPLGTVASNMAVAGDITYTHG